MQYFCTEVIDYNSLHKNLTLQYLYTEEKDCHTSHVYDVVELAFVFSLSPNIVSLFQQWWPLHLLDTLPVLYPKDQSPAKVGNS